MKKILALVLALTLALGTFSFAAAAPEDVVGTDCESEVARLVALGILAGYPDGTFRPDQPVTRAEFAKIIVSALGVGEAAQYAAGATKFWDVATDHWATGYINVAVDVGIINGYPDGTFQPENQVTFAEAIKMIVAALGYTPKAEAMGGYPGGYLAIAAEKEISDGVNVIGTLSANRGAVAMMVDNALEVDLMEQTAFGDRPEWREIENKNLLNTKLGYNEIKGDVVEIARVNSKLDDNEFKLAGDSTTYELLIDVNTESLFLKEVKIFEKDDEVVWVKVNTAEADLVFDTVKQVMTEEEEDTVYTGVKLKVKDKEYDWVRNPVVYVNYEEADEEDVQEDMYGLFVFDGKEIKAANLFKFEDEGLVTEVDEDELEYVAFDNTEDVLPLDEYDAVYYYNKDFSKAEFEDIDENSAIFFWDVDDDDEELFVVVVNDVVEGEVTRLRSDKISIDGTNYDMADEAIASLNEGKDFKVWDVEEVKDLADEEAVAVLDFNGDVVAVIGTADVTSDTMYGVVTWAETGRTSVLSIFGADGKVVDYELEKRAQIEVGEKDLSLLDYMGVFGDPVQYAVVSFELNSDGEIADGTLEVVWVDDNAPDASDINEADVEIGIFEKEADKAYMFDGSLRIYADEGTVIFQAIDDGELDPGIITYDEFRKMEFKIDGDKTQAAVFGEEGKTAKLIVFTHEDFDGLQKDVYYGVVTDNAWRVGSNWKSQIDVFGEGKDDYTLKAAGDRDDIFVKGTLLAFKLDGNDKASATVYRVLEGSKTGTAADGEDIVTGYVYDVDTSGGYIEVGPDGSSTEVYKVKSGAVMYVTKSDGAKLDGTTRLARIDVNQVVYLLLDDDEEVAAMVVIK
jgi:hypothetical protein